MCGNMSKQKTARQIIGTQLKALRKSRGLHQDFVGKQIGLTSSNMSRMEKGDFGPWKIKTIQKWFAIFGIPVEIGKDTFTIAGKFTRPIDALEEATHFNGKSHSPKSKRVVRKRKR